MRRVRRKGGSKDKVFGCDLLEHLTTSCQEIPRVLRCCSEFVEQKGVVDGIYRLSGVSSNIQKLRGEFEGDGKPDLHKDVYLQDIHCVSSLCKAYFRELPNPLLTYQLYDKFAEAVALQLEEERLVKIRDVLQELPEPHYRTLEFLMQHLVRMASFSSETNMHARNLAIVWAPNLLRSKDIEASGFNGTAAFMEVRVQSIVVEFILTHVPQLFPQQGVSQRRTSLPSPSVMSNQNEAPFKTLPPQPHANFGNVSPGDGPIAIRPYHAIIEGTDKRKGSLKGRRWMSIFNIGGRFHDQRKRHKNSTKEKGQTSLRPARSMDSLSHSSYPNEVSRGAAQPPLSTHLSPNVHPTPQHSSDMLVSPGAIGGSKYAVTYRRGTGLVNANVGSQSANAALDPEGSAANETLQSRSPGLSSKAGRRAAMHITGPTTVTVPLHITSNLALGVLQGGGGDRVIHCVRQKGEGDREKERGGKEQREAEKKVKTEEESKESEEIKQAEITAVVGGADTERDQEERKTPQPEMEIHIQPQSLSTEQQVQRFTSNDEEPKVKDDDDTTADLTVGRQDGGEVSDTSDVTDSPEVDDQGLCGYVQDNFEFLDQMDCSILDHMEPGVSHQVIEFSVEPPGHSDEEYEHAEEHRCSRPPSEEQLHPQSPSGKQSQSPTESKPLRPSSLDLNRHTKSLSLPFIISPVHGPEDSESSSFEEDEEEEEEEENVSEDSDDSSMEGDESMFVKSLPSDFFLNHLPEWELDTQHQVLPRNVPSELETKNHSLNLEEKECEENHQVQPDADQQRNLNMTSEAAASNWDEFPLQSTEILAEKILNTDAPVEEALEETPANKEQDLSTTSTEEESDENDQTKNRREEETTGSKPKEEEEDRSDMQERQEVMCELIEDCENEAAGRQEEVLEYEEEEKKLNLMLSGENMAEDCRRTTRKTEVKEEIEEETLITEAGLIQVREADLDEHSGEPHPDSSEEPLQPPENKDGADDRQACEHREPIEKSDNTLEGLGSKLVVSKQPKVYQAKAVPVVPPKPQYCKVTSRTLRQQQQQQQQHESEAANVEECVEKRERTPRRAVDPEREQRWDGADGTIRESSRNSPLSMCFDEAVAKATLRREKERREVEVEAEALRK